MKQNKPSEYASKKVTIDLGDASPKKKSESVVEETSYEPFQKTKERVNIRDMQKPQERTSSEEVKVREEV